MRNGFLFLRKRRELKYGNLFTASGFTLFLCCFGVASFFVCFEICLQLRLPKSAFLCPGPVFPLRFRTCAHLIQSEIQYFSANFCAKTCRRYISELRKPFLANFDSSHAKGNPLNNCSRLLLPLFLFVPLLLLLCSFFVA